MFRYLHEHHQAFLPIQSINIPFLFRYLHEHHQGLLSIKSINARYIFRYLHAHHQTFLPIQFPLCFGTYMTIIRPSYQSSQ
jgi:hypothetical protein